MADWIELAAAAHPDGLVNGETLLQSRKELEMRRGRPLSPRKQDAWVREAEGVWELLRSRADHYGDLYPFVVAEDDLEITTVALDRLKLGYGFLLAASNLSAFDVRDRHLLTTGFERASRHVLAALLPERSTVNIFGTSSAAGERYSQGRLLDRLEALASDLASRLTHEARSEAEDSVPRISGDGGLDLVGWPELIGPRKRLPVYFAQCACGDDWHRKPYEVLESTWSHRIEPVSPIVPVTFIPYAYRGQSHDWLDLFVVIPTVLIDRPRWLNLVAATECVELVLEDVPRAWILAELPGLIVEDPEEELT